METAGDEPFLYNTNKQTPLAGCGDKKKFRLKIGNEKSESKKKEQKALPCFFLVSDMNKGAQYKLTSLLKKRFSINVIRRATQ